MSSEDGSLWITFNGEIYNHADIRRELETRGHRFRSSSDTEVLLKAFQEWGAQCLDRLNGMFAFAIFDERSNKLFAARDRLGVKPFYYHHNQGAFLFSSEIKALLSSGLVDKHPDYAALHTPARFQISPLTGFKDIYKLPPAHYLTFEAGDLTIHRYWSIQTREDPPSSDADTIEQLDGLLKDAARLQMISDVPVGVFLSGGVDSSLISALVRANTAQQVHSFTIKFSDKDQKFEKMPRDEVYARQVAEQFDFRFHEFELSPDIATLFPKLVWHLDEPLADPAAINTYLISQAARDSGIIVLLNGMGGDEIFGGYRKQLACLKAELYQTFAPPIVRHTLERLASCTRCPFAGRASYRSLDQAVPVVCLDATDGAVSHVGPLGRPRAVQQNVLQCHGVRGHPLLPGTTGHDVGSTPFLRDANVLERYPGVSARA